MALDGLLAISEIFQNLLNYGDKNSMHLFKHALLNAVIEPNNKTVSILDFFFQFMKTLKEATDLLIDNRLYEQSQKFRSNDQSTAPDTNKHPFGVILTRVTKILHTFTSENPELVGSKIDNLLSLNQFEYLDFLIYFTKP